MPSLPSILKSDFKPKASTDTAAINNLSQALAAEFEAFEPSPKHSFKGRTPAPKDIWPIIEPKHAPTVVRGKLPDVFDRVLQSCWKATEPIAGAGRGHILAGTRGMSFASQAATQGQTYHPQVRPSRVNIESKFPNKDAIASDWSVIKDITRTNAVVFRGDTRTPNEVIVKCGGFNSPITRTDDHYLVNSNSSVYFYFDDYLQRRYGRRISKAEFLNAIRSASPSAADKKLLVEYTVWRQILQREAAHLGRMVENEIDKGWISCSKSIETSMAFGTGLGNQSGWLYLTIVHAAFIVPFMDAKTPNVIWGSGEAEVAQWGNVPAERIVGFRYLSRAIGYRPDGPIFMRRSFRKKEAKAFEYMYNVMSGWVPSNRYDSPL